MVEKGEHMFCGKKFFMKFPIAEEERKMNIEKENGSSIVSNSDFGKIVEVHGDIGVLGKEHLLMYLENPKLSGGGEIKKSNFDAHPPWVEFLHSRGKLSSM